MKFIRRYASELLGIVTVALGIWLGVLLVQNEQHRRHIKARMVQTQKDLQQATEKYQRAKDSLMGKPKPPIV